MIGHILPDATLKVEITDADDPLTVMHMQAVWPGDIEIQVEITYIDPGEWKVGAKTDIAVVIFNAGAAWREFVAGEFYRAPEKKIREFVRRRSAESDDIFWLNLECALRENDLEADAFREQYNRGTQAAFMRHHARRY